MGLFKRTEYKKKIVRLLLLTTFISMLPVSTFHEHPAEASTWSAVCPQGGSAQEVADFGCSACGGSGKEWTKPEASDGSANNLSSGSGLDKNTTTEEDTTFPGVVWRVYYRCYNCGECPRQSIVAKKVVIQSNSPAFNVGDEVDFGTRGPGTVPLRWCTICGPALKSNGEKYLGREASYGVYHVDMNITPEPVTPEVKKYTVTVNYTNGGYAYAEKATYNAGESVKVHAEAEEGYCFTKWTVESGSATGLVTNSSDTSFCVSSDVVLKASFEKLPTPPPTRPPTQAPQPNTYTLTVSAGEGGSASVTSGEKKYYHAGDKVTVGATPNDSCTFLEWSVIVEDGNETLEFDTASSSVTFNMPKSNVTLTARFNTPPLTNTDYVEEYYRYYTTDEGYSTDRIYAGTITPAANDYYFGYLADGNSVNGSGQLGTGWSNLSYSYYQEGKDASGNVWYFVPKGTNATYVHPKTYNGYKVDTEDIRYITELTFPETITSYGTVYTVTSIGGGGNCYRDESDSDPRNPPVYRYSPETGHFSYSYLSTGYGDPTYSEYFTYQLGVLGNGSFQSNGYTYTRYSNGTRERYDYANKYYVYNTTLKYVTIPDTVTEIKDYAFSHCQALEKISGAETVMTIGAYAFEAAKSLEPKTSVIKKNSYGYQTYTKLYYYNGAYSFGGPTAGMIAWKNRAALSEYMELPGFSSLKTIEACAFYYHTNLYNVKLPAGLSTIDYDAFAYCNLNSITIPGKSTEIKGYGGSSSATKDCLGTKGSVAEDKTVIITVPESNAMYYGLLFSDYYSLRAGHEVTYHKNASPAETYVSVAALNEIYEKTVSQKGNVYLDDDGDLFLYDRQKDIFATQIAPGTKFNEIKTMNYLVWDNWDNVYDTVTAYFAIGTNGELWGEMGNGWTKVTMPAGAHSFQFSGNGHYVWVYYLDADGQICVVRICANQTSGLWYNHEQIVHDYPSSTASYQYDKIVVESEGNIYPGAGITLDYAGSTYYNGTPPQLVAHVASDSTYKPDSLVRFYAYPLESSWDAIGDNYAPPGEVASYSTPEFWIYQETSTNGSEKYGDGVLYSSDTGYDIYYIAEDGLYCTKYKGTSGYTKTFVGGGTFYEAASIEKTKIMLLKGPAGTFAVAPHKKRLYQITTEEIKDVWGYSSRFYLENYNLMGNFLYLLDGKGDLHCVFDCTASYSYNDFSGAVKLVSNAKKVVRDSAHSAMLILDENGVIWSIGRNSYGALAYSGAYVENNYNPQWYYYNISKVDCNSGTPVFTEISIFDADNYSSYADGTRPAGYSLALDTAGNVYAAGYSYDYFGDYETHYSGYTKVSGPMKSNDSAPESEIRIGYDFTELLYESMFTREGKDFLFWNTSADGTGTSYQPGERVKVNEPLHLYAQWGQKSNIIHYFPNGGEGYMEEDALDASIEKVALKKNIFTKKGYAFVSWNTKADGTGTSYADGEVITVPKGSTSLFAQWRKISAYTVQTAADDVTVRPVVITSSKKLEAEDTYTIPEALTSKFFEVSYDLRKETTGTSIPEITLTKENREATLLFFGWMLYEKTGEDAYAFCMKRYLPGTIAQYLATSEGATMVLFPYWSGDVSGVILPVPTCKGYDFIGWGFTDNVTNPNNLIRLEGGVTSTYKPAADTTLYAYWKPKECVVVLDDRGATTAGQGTVTLQYDKKGDKNGNGVLVPKKTGYTFKGYYTGTRGSGTMYFDENGQGTQVWKGADIKTLYACWAQDDVILPDKDVVSEPQLPQNGRWEVDIYKDSAEVRIYADDYDASTGALTDKQPYLVSDVVIDGRLEAAGAIPSTEHVALRARMGAWMFSGVFEQKSGVEKVCVKVTVPYRTQYENAEDESLVISEVQTKTMEFMIPKAWSYWTLAEGGIYFPEKVIAENAALQEGRVEVPVVWDRENTAQKPEYQATVYGEKENHVVWSPDGIGVSRDTDKTPLLALALTETEYIISDTPGVEPDVTEYLTNVCYNAAWSDETQFRAKSDTVAIEGITLLSGREVSTGTGAGPQPDVIEQIRGKIQETTYDQTYQSGIPLLVTAKNGRYETKAWVQYNCMEAERKQKIRHVVVKERNELNIHTPVVCIPSLTANHEDMVQCELASKDSTPLVLDEEGIHSDFVLQIRNTGYHSEKRGYGTKSYAKYLAQKDGKEQNEVLFPFAVWIDIGNDKENQNDTLLEAGTWYTLGDVEQRFYLPVWTEEGKYEIQVRSVAVNGVGEEEKTEEERNTRPANYVAEQSLSVVVTGRLFDFTVYEVGGTVAWEEAKAEDVCYTVGEHAPEFSEWDTLPLRRGVHPYYRNVGGLPTGGYIRFTVHSIGSTFAADATLTILPYLFRVTENGYQEVDVYYEEVTDRGVFLKQWKAENQVIYGDTVQGVDTEKTETINPQGREEGNAILQYEEKVSASLQEWNGTFRLPARLYVAEAGTDVLNYQKLHGLSFTEDFWIKDAILMVRFPMKIEKKEGEILYYGMLPDGIVNNIWKKEAGASYRYDSKERRYEIQGGEVAVIYPGDSIKNETTTNGIY